MTIRPYQKKDKEALLHLLRMNTPQFFGADEEVHFITYLADDSDHYFVSVINDTIVGCGGINYFHNDKLARISWDIVHPDHQGKGIGKQLTTHRINEIKKNGHIRTIQVRTSQVAFKFYEKMGFVLEEIVKDYWSKGFDLYRMHIQLSTGE